MKARTRPNRVLRFAPLLASLAIALSLGANTAVAQESKPLLEEEAKALRALADTIIAENETMSKNEFSAGEFCPLEVAGGEEAPAVEACPLFYENELCAIVFKATMGGETTYTLDESTGEIFSEYVTRDNYVSLETDSSHRLIAETNVGKSFITSDEGLEHLSDEQTDMSLNMSHEMIDASIIPLDNIASAQSASVTDGFNLYQVNHIYQNGDQICWAAAAAQIGHWLTKDTSVSPWYIAKQIKGGYVEGTSADTIAAYNYFCYDNGTHMKVYCKTGEATLDDISKRLKYGLPIQMDFRTIGAPGHSVTIDGFSRWSDGSESIRIVDSARNTSTGHATLYRDRNNGHFTHTNTVNGEVYWAQSGAQTYYPLGWHKPFGKTTWSYFTKEGIRYVGWHQIGKYWYFFNTDGVMLTGWQKVLDKWYYLDSSGAMETGWLSYGGSWYYLDTDGSMITGWASVDGYWYYMGDNGAMDHGWLYDDGYWYYLRKSTNSPSGGPEGSMLSNGSWYIDGKTYRFDSSGHCLNP